MSRDAFRRWGAAQSARYDRQTTGDHVLSRAREFAPMTRERAEKRLRGRDGISRRLLMGAAAGRTTLAGVVLPVPTWACDPVAGKESREACGPIRGAGGDGAEHKPASWVDPLPDELRWVERGYAHLARINTMRARVFREEFSGTGTQTMKAGRIAAEYGGTFTVWQYRAELAKAIAFVEARGF